MATTPVITENVAGPFNMTWAPLGSGAATLGVTSRGIREIRRYEGEEIPADLLGNSMVEAVHLGSQMFLEFDLEEANRQVVMQLSHPFYQTAISNLADSQLYEGEHGVPGMMHTDVYGLLVATPAFTNLNSAGAQSTPVRTYHRCTLAAGWEMSKLLSARRRVVPIRLRVWPVLDSADSKYKFYSKSALP